MKFKTLVYLFFIFVGSSVRAETHYLLVDPGTSPTSNYYRYYNDVRRAYETLVSQGKQPKVFAKNGKWVLQQHKAESLMTFSLDPKAPPITGSSSSELTYPPITGSAGTVDDFMKAIKSMPMKEGDTVVFYITAHGGSPQKNNDPSASTILAWNQEIKFQDFQKALEQVPRGVKVKLITTTCFGGGIHSISRNLPNVCSSSTAPFSSLSYAGGFDEFHFNRGLWDKFKDTKGKTNFAEMNLNGFAGDPANENLGRLSSFDFVDFVLKKGPYEKNYSDRDFPWEIVEKDGLFDKISPPRGYSYGIQPDATILKSNSIPSSLEAGVCQNCCSGGVQSDVHRHSGTSVYL